MRFVADLHVHSRFSRATAKNLDFENLYIAAQLKGISIVGTGDFTHPAWLAEIKEKLIPAQDGFLKLRQDIARTCDQKVPPSCRGRVRFILAAEISNIYKKNIKTRKNHNLVLFPSIEAVEQINSKLASIGNIHSDGRPILGLDAKSLLELVLEIGENALLIPAHIWTPWFSLLGSKSGFDSIEECFEDLSEQIFAVETGLSSDPAMNWRVSDLDNRTLVSNSDAHSPLNLGREANLFNTDFSYEGLIEAIKSGDKSRFVGTFEFYPEEGKYHWDGHRKCDLRLEPKDSRKNKGICPKCGKPLTLGVLYRVEELADRPKNRKPEKTRPYYTTIPLASILSEIFRLGPKTKTVQNSYYSVLDTLGPEFKILHSLEIDDIEKFGLPLLGEAIARMRRREVTVLPGYDGAFGIIKIFTPEERAQKQGQKRLFTFFSKTGPAELFPMGNKLMPPESVRRKPRNSFDLKIKKSKIVNNLNTAQQRVVAHKEGPLLIIAGPGTGKTHTLTHRIAHLISERVVPPENILAVTFTNKAAREMQTRLQRMIKAGTPMPLVTTFHALAYRTLTKLKKNALKTIVADEDRKILLKESVRLSKDQGHLTAASQPLLLERIMAAKQRMLGPEDNLEAVAIGIDKKTLSVVYRTYQELLSIQGLYDYEDLIFNLVKIVENPRLGCTPMQSRFKYIFVDEYQDINQAQYRLIRKMSTPPYNICVIGDPKQAIYGFRGSSAGFFQKFLSAFPGATIISLTQNYRSTQTIVAASSQVIKKPDRTLKALKSSLNVTQRDCFEQRLYSDKKGEKAIGILEAATGRAEAVSVGKTIEKLIGGIGFHYMDFGGSNAEDFKKQRSFSDFAVLYRTSKQNQVFSEIFSRAGLPFYIASRENFLFKRGISEILSLLRIIEGVASVADLERIKDLKMLGLMKKGLAVLKTGLYKQKSTVAEILAKAELLPFPGRTQTGRLPLLQFLSTIEKLKAATKGMNAYQKLLYLARYTQIDSRMETDPQIETAFKKLLNLARKPNEQSLEFLAEVSLQSDTDMATAGSEKISLMTMHASKGLEFPVVFIVGCEKGFIPLHRRSDENSDIEEEKRLFYVAMTRAKDMLFLSYAQKRHIFGRTARRRISPFVEEIEEQLKKVEKSDFNPRGKKFQNQLKLF